MKKIHDSVTEIRQVISPQSAIVLVGGCFDLLHVAHLRLLEHAKSLGDILVTCVLSDSYIQSYKGVHRPIIKQEYRATLVAGLECVDYVFISNVGSSNTSILAGLSPQKILFGLENEEHSINRRIQREEKLRDLFPSIELCYLERFADETISTSAIIAKIKNTAHKT